MQPQGQSTAFDDCRVIPEQTDQLGRKEECQSGNTTKETEGAFDAEPKAFLDPVLELSTIVKAAEGLEALAETDHGGSAELHQPLYHAHGCDQNSSVGRGGMV